MKSKLCELLGIQYPIIQGGMAWVSTAKLAAGVSNAGGLGIIAAGNAPADAVREQITRAKQLTDQPFGVNVMLLSPYVEEIVDLVCEEKVAALIFGAGSAPKSYIDKLKAAGVKVIHVVPSVAIAKKAEKNGVDAIVAEGGEAGGHIGELSTMVLVPQVADAVSVPVVAAGGIADSRGIAAAFALGAQGVQVGTRFICADECEAHENYKLAVVHAKDRDAIVTGRSTGHPVRCLKNKLAKRMLDAEAEGLSREEFEKLGIGGLRRAVVDGDADNGSLMAGQSAAMVTKIQSCQEIIDELVGDYGKVVDSLKAFE